MQTIKLAKTWHLFHLIMTILTGGFWLIIWLWRGLANAHDNKNLLANVQVQQNNRNYQELQRINNKISPQSN